MDALFYGSLLSELSSIPFYALDENGQITHIFCQHTDEANRPEFEKKLWASVMQALATENFMFRSVEGLPIAMCGARVQGQEGIFLWGPVRFRRFSAYEEMKYRNLFKADSGYTLPEASLHKLAAAVACFKSVLTGEKVSSRSVLRGSDTMGCHLDDHAVEGSEKHLFDYQMRTEDDALMNHTYAEEQRMWDAVKVGDTEKVKALLELPQLKHPMVIENNPLLNEAFMAVSTVTLLARIAIGAGVSSKEGFMLSDIYLKRISRCRELSEIEVVSIEARLDFTKLVRKHRLSKARNPHVENCKKYITANIFKKITLAGIAEVLEMRPAYLSRLFSEYEGVTVTEYVILQKIDLAKNMLRFSDRRISEIANYLNFSSQSYFGKRFKAVTGMSPIDYRDQFQQRDY